MAYFSAATAILTATNCRKDMNFGVAVDRSCQTSWGKRLSNTNHQTRTESVTVAEPCFCAWELRFQCIDCFMYGVALNVNF